VRTYATGEGQARALAFAPDHALWFANSTSIGRLTSDGKVRLYKDPRITSSYAIAVATDGTVWATVGERTIGRLTKDGLLRVYTVPKTARYWYGIFDMGVGADGALWFATGATFVVGRLSRDGHFRMYTDRNISDVSSITAGPDGALWFTNGGNSIGRITTAGKIRTFESSKISSPRGITVGPDGALWFTNEYGGTIGRITTAGAVSVFTTDYPTKAQVLTPPW
jgi:virginiamycin B lyase